MKTILILLTTLGFFVHADGDHTPYVSCPSTNVIYDGLNACPENCVAIPKDVNIRIMKCSNGQLSEDSAKKSEYERKIAESNSKKDERNSIINELKKSTNPEIRKLIDIIEMNK